MKRLTLEFDTEANGDIVNISPALAGHISKIKGDGLLHVFVIGSTAAVTTIEHEPGLVRRDMPAMMQRLIPDDIHYEHEATWNDDNGHAHLRAAVIGPSVTIPFGQGKLLTGEYQQVVLINFDTRPRRRRVIITVIGGE